MQHILQFTIILTAITFFAMFWASTGSQETEIATDNDVAVPQSDSIATEVVSQQRKSDSDSMPSSSGAGQSSSNYSVLGVN